MNALTQQLELRPSGAACWVVCRGFLRMNAGIPDNDGEADTEIREQGTAAHWVAAELLWGRSVAEGTIAPNGVEADGEMLEGVAIYMDVIRAWDIPVYVEQLLLIPRIHATLKGTPDVWGVNYAKRRIYLADFKFGYSYVEVYECWQLICYLAGIIDLIPDFDDQTWTVEFVIVQPRSYGRDIVRRWCSTVSDLRAHFNILADAAHEAIEGTGMCKVGPHCINCGAQFRCQTLQTAALSELHRKGHPVVLDLPPVALGNELRILEYASKLIDARINGLKAEALQRLRSGAIVPYYEISHAAGRERWKSPEAEAHVISLGRLMNKDLSKPQRAITPTQARKLLSPTVVDQFASRPSGEAKLVPSSEARTRRMFGKP